MGTKGKLKGSAAALACLASMFVAASVVSCGDSGVLKRMFDIEDRSQAGTPPSTIEELKAGIAEYEKEADRTVNATEKIGVYWRMLATKYMDKRMFGESYEAAREAVKYFPDNASLFYIAGLSASYLAKAEATAGSAGTGKRDEYYKIAEDSLKRSIEYDDRYVRPLYALAVLYVFELDRPAEAEPYLDRLLAIETRNVDAMFVLGRVYFVSGRYELAAKLYEKIAVTTTIDEKKKQAEENRKQALDALYGDK